MNEPVVAFSSETGHYTADACVVWCFDDRFYKLLKAFGKHVGFDHIDLVKVAGGAKALAGNDAAERDFVLGQVQASVRLHKTPKVILMVHRDCGAYGGSKGFASSEAEKEHHVAELAVAKKLVEGAVPGVTVETHFADFDGLYTA